MENSQLIILQDVANKLTSAGIEYMVTGSVASFIYGMPRMTHDIDIVVKIFTGNKDIIIKAFETEYLVSEEDIDFALKNDLMFNFFHREKAAKIDFIVQKKTEYRLTEFSRRKFVSSEKFSGYIASLEDLIISKVDWAKDSLSEQQSRDIKFLLKNPVDEEYLNHWLNELNLREIFNKLIHD
jgi:hypothetical protein